MQRAIDWIFLVILAVFVVMFAIGKGDELLGFFSSKEAAEFEKLYDKKKMNRATLIFCIVLLITEIVQGFLAPGIQSVQLICLVVSIAAFVAYIAYMQKIRRDKR